MTISASDWQRIQRFVEQMVSVVVHGQTADTQIDDAPSTESIDNCPPGNPTIAGRPVMHPYGLASRAKKETVSVVARVGAHPANKMVIGHRDKDRPALGAAGEVALYDAFGNVIHLKDGKIVMKLGDKLELGEGATKEAARKGDSIEFTVTSALAAAITSSPSGGPCSLSPGPPVKISGTITSGSAKVTITD